MRACVWILGACALFLAGNASAADATVTLSVGQLLNTRIDTFPHSHEEIICYLETPTGETHTFVRDDKSELYQAYDYERFEFLPFSLLSSCAVNVRLSDAQDAGVWRLYYTTTSGASAQRTFRVIMKDEQANDNGSTTPAEESDRTVENLNGLIFNTAIGITHEIRINRHDFVNTESCHIVTPNGDEHNLEDVDLISTLGIKVLQDSNTACGVELTVLSENSVGRWTLFSRDTRFSNRIERRLNITINVEESVDAMPSDVIITEGSDMYVRLAHPTPHYETCKLTGPNGRTETPHKIDENHKSSCGFIVPNVKMDYSGLWEIVYGDSITYTAVIFVNVNTAWEGAVTQLQWLKDRPVHMEVGPNDAVYCRIAAPEEVVVFESFGRCSINLDRATDQHSGTWTMVIGTPGKVLTELHTVTVHVKSTAAQPKVVTRVESQQPAVLLTCAIEGESSIRSCKFRDPSGRVLMAPQGVGEDRYSFHGVGISLESNVTKSDCGLRIVNPIAEEMGIWRCSVVTFEDQVHHGFLTVSAPWVTPEADTVMAPTEPTLTANHELIEAVEGDSVTMSCAIQEAIHYCYFRARNGTVFNVAPSTQSEAMEYVGAGFSAGECGIRFRNLLDRDSGAWSCHIGSTTQDAREQRANFNVYIHKAMVAEQRQFASGLVVDAYVHNDRALEYCRYVRIDGLGFGSFSAILPDRVSIHDDLSRGHCSIHIDDATTQDRHPWTVVAKLVGQEVEVSASTGNSLEMPGQPGPPSQPPHIVLVRQSYTWVLFFMLGLSLVAMSLSMTTKNNREWVSRRATTLRDSFRKQPLPTHVAHNAHNTAMAA